MKSWASAGMGDEKLIKNLQKEKDEHSNTKARLQKVLEEKEKLDNDLNKISKELEHSRLEHDESIQSLEALDSQHTDEMTQLLELKKDSEEKFKVTKKELVKLQNEVQQLTEKLTNSQKQESFNVQEVQSKLSATENLLSETKQKLTKTQQQFEEGKKELLMLRAERYELKNEIRDLKEASIEMQSRENSDRCEDEEKLQMEIHKYKKKTDSYDMKLAEMEDKYLSEISGKCENIKSLEEDVSNLRSAISRLESDLQATREQGLEVENNLNEDLKASKTKFEDLLSENISHKSKLSEKIAELEGVRRLCETAEAKAKQFKFDGEKVKEVLEKKIQQTLAEKTNDIEVMNKEHQVLVQNMRAENKDYIRELKQNYELASKDLTDSLNEITIERDDLQQKVSVLGAKFENAQQRLKAAAEVEEERLLMSSETRDETQKLIDQIKYLEKNVEMSKEHNLKLTSQKESIEKEALITEKNKNELEATLKELTEKHHDIEQSVNQLSRDLFEEKTKVKKLQEEKSEILSKLESQTSSEKSLEFSKELDESKQKVSELEAYVEKFEMDHDNLVKDLKSEIEKLKNKTSIQSNEEEKDQMMSIINEKTRENRQLKDEARNMMDFMQQEKDKVQKLEVSNNEYKRKYEGLDIEMTRDTVKNLSKLIREKDLQIESLEQKCKTLLDVLQQQDGSSKDDTEASKSTTTGYSSEQINSLLKERETLTKQIHQLVTLIQSKHEENLVSRQQLQKAAESMERDQAENSQLQVKYTNLVFDYEQLQLKIQGQQRQLDRMNTLVADLQISKKSLQSKLNISDDNEVNVEKEILSRNSDVSNEEVEQLRKDISKKQESLRQKDLLVQDAVKRANEIEKKMLELRKEVQQKEQLLQRSNEEISKLSSDMQIKSNDNAILRKSCENLKEQISEMAEMRTKMKELERISQERTSETEAFQETNQQLTMMIKKQQYEQENLKSQVDTLKNAIKTTQQGKETETQNYLQKIENYRNEITHIKQERDKYMMALNQKNSEARRNSVEIKALEESRNKLTNELDRLRTHLVEVEQSYTEDALINENRKNELESLLENERQSSVSLKSSNHEIGLQSDRFRESLLESEKQKEHAINQYQLAQEKTVQYAQALQQLKSACERMQREDKIVHTQQIHRVQSKLNEKAVECDEYKSQVDALTSKLNEVNEALEIASRLSEQLELKQEDLERVNQIANEKQTLIEQLQKNISQMQNRNKTMVDRDLVKNLFIGYFSSPTNKQNDVIKLIVSVIGFTKDEEEKLNPSRKGLLGSLLSWKPQQLNIMNQSGENNESFSQMFVKFLESESQLTNQNRAKLPAVAMAAETQQKIMNRKMSSTSIPTPEDTSNITAKNSEENKKIAGRYNPPILIPSHNVISSSSQSPFVQPTNMRFQPLVSNSNKNNASVLQNILKN